jgi:hypothetical protein
MDSATEVPSAGPEQEAKPARVEKVVQITSYERDERKAQYPLNEQPPIDWKAAMQDLATRIETLQKAASRVIVTVDERRIVLATVVLVDPPKPQAPPKRDDLTADELLRALTLKLGGRPMER